MAFSPKYQPLKPKTFLRRIRDIFASSTSATSSASPSINFASPLLSCTSSQFSGLQLENLLSTSLGDNAIDARRIIQRKKSIMEVEREEEQCLLSGELISIVEPRPTFGVALGGIEEVLSGRI